MAGGFDVIVIGGGAAGMMAAGRAGECGARVLILEKNDRLGKKLSITGGRRCNITNAEFNTRDFLENFPGTKQFLYSPFSQFDVQSTFDFFEGRGLPLIVEDRKRAFPKSEKAEDVCRVLEKYCAQSGNVTARLTIKVEGLVVEGDKITGVRAGGQTFLGKRVIVATGGLAAPETGSTGEGLDMLATIGHTVHAPNPNLAPLKTNADWVHSLSGISVDDIGLRYLQNGKTQWKNAGRLLFTHFGISGPMVINSAYAASELMKKGPVIASLDLFPELDHGAVDQKMIALFEENKNKNLGNFLPTIIPRKMSEVVLRMIDRRLSDTMINAVSKEERKALVSLMKDLQFPLTGTMGFDWSIVADGGVEPKEIDFKTMRSKIYSNLYLIGDTININRPSGGYSLQLCWTTGWIAGTNAASH